MNSSLSATFDTSAADSVFVLPLIPLIDYPSADQDEDDLAPAHVGSDSDLDDSRFEPMD